MSFLHPNFLFALALVAVPIIIHLFDLQRSRKVYFTNMGLLKNVSESTTSSRKIKHLLVLLSRILFIISLVLAFAQPFVKSKDSNVANENSAGMVAFYFDNSQSMQNTFGNGNLLDESASNAMELAQIFPKNSKFLYLDNNFSSFSKNGIPKDKFKDKVSEIIFSNNAQTFENVYRKIETEMLSNGNKATKKIFWYSDFQKSTLGNLSKIKIDTNIQIYLRPIQNQESGNYFVDSLWLDNYFVRAGKINKLSLKIRNSGNSGNTKIKLKLFVDNIQSANTSVEVKENSFEVVNFDLNVDGNSLKRCRIEVEDNNLKFDNQYFFTLQPNERINILEVSEGQTQYIKNVYANEESFNWKHNKFGNISLSDVEKSQLLIINEFDKLNISEVKNLKLYIQKGGSVLLFPSINPQSKIFEQIIDILELPNISMGLTAHTPVAIKFPDTKNPFFENVFEKIDKNTDMPVGNSSIIIGTKGNNLLLFNTDVPFLTSFDIGKGKISICSSPLTEPYTNFQKHAIFVPVMYKLAMNASNTVSKPAYNFSSKNVALKINERVFNDTKYSINKDKFAFIPEQRKKDGNLYFDMPGLSLDPGFYEVKFADSLINTLAFNYESKESQMDFYTTAQLKELFATKKNIIVVESDLSTKFVDDFKNSHFGLSLWKYFIVAALLFLLIEIFLLKLK